MSIKKKSAASIMILLLGMGLFAFPAHAQQGDWSLIGWNDLGMHCMDADYSVMAILPPYNTIHAQLIDPGGNLVKQPNGIQLS